MLHQVKDWMTKKPLKADIHEDARAVGKLMHQEGVGHYLVFDEGRLVGVISEKDLKLINTLINKISSKNKEESTITVGDIMSRTVTTVSSDAKMSEAMKIMKERHIHCLPVMDSNHKVSGILTWSDILMYALIASQHIEKT